MSRVPPQARESVEIVPRRYMTLDEKLTCWLECHSRCTVCGEFVPISGPDTIWDHRIALALGGTNDLSNMEPHHAKPCAAIKTAADRKAIAKAKRRAKKAAGETKATKPIRSQGFQKGLTRGFDGKVRERG